MAAQIDCPSQYPTLLWALAGLSGGDGRKGWRGGRLNVATRCVLPVMSDRAGCTGAARAASNLIESGSTCV